METGDLKGKTAKGLLWGGLGTGMVQVMSLVFGIFLARLLTAADYGIVGLLTIFTHLSCAFAESGFVKALINRPGIEHKDYNAVFWFSLIVSVACYIILFFCAPLIARFYNEPRLVALSRYAFLGIIVSCMQISASACMYKKLMVKERTICIWTALIVSNSVGLILAFKGFAHWGIVTQSILSSLTNLICIFIFSGWRPSFKISFSPLKEMFPYSIKLLGTRILTVINTNLFTIFLGRFFPLNAVGNYNQANKWGFMGYSMMTNTMLNVTQPVLSSISPDEKERHYAAFRKMVRFTAFTGFPLLFGLAFIAREFIVILITEKWIESAAMLSILSIGYAFYVISFVFSETLAERGRSDWYLIVSAISGILQLACLFLLHPYGITVMLLSGIGVQLISLILWYVFIRKSMGYTCWHFIGDIFSYAGIAATVVVLTHILLYWTGISNIYLLLFLKIGLVAALYIGVLAVLRSVILKESYQYLKITFSDLFMKIIHRHERNS